MHNGLVVASIATALAAGTPVLMAATGELLVEKVGMFNIGVEGMMLAGALGGFLADNFTHSWVASVFVAAAVGGFTAVLFGVCTVFLRANMVIVGLALILVARGLTGQIGAQHVLERATSRIGTWHVPGLSSIPYVGSALFKQPVTTYIALILVALVGVFLTRTRQGLNMRAVGENPVAADAAGVRVLAVRFGYVVVGGLFAGAAGAVLVLAQIGTWNTDVTAGQGFIAFAVVFFSGWRAGGLVVGAYLFGALTTLGNIGQAEGWSIPSEVFAALPYLGTVVVMVMRAGIRRQQGLGLGWPAALGVPFYRE